MQFSIERSDSVMTARGDLDAEAVRHMRAAFSGIDEQAVDLDLSGVTFIDSMGIMSLIQVHNEHPGVSFVAPSPTVRRVFDLMGLLEFLGRRA